jgi:hypothetical protein
MNDKDFDLTRRSFLDHVLKASAGAGMAALPPGRRWPAPTHCRPIVSGSA